MRDLQNTQDISSEPDIRPSEKVDTQDPFDGKTLTTTQKDDLVSEAIDQLPTPDGIEISAELPGSDVETVDPEGANSSTREQFDPRELLKSSPEQLDKIFEAQRAKLKASLESIGYHLARAGANEATQGRVQELFENTLNNQWGPNSPAHAFLMGRMSDKLLDNLLRTTERALPHMTSATQRAQRTVQTGEQAQEAGVEAQGGPENTSAELTDQQREVNRRSINFMVEIRNALMQEKYQDFVNGIGEIEADRNSTIAEWVDRDDDPPPEVADKVDGQYDQMNRLRRVLSASLLEELFEKLK